MRIVIDMQGAQSTGSRSRGIGRYTMSLAQGMIRNRGPHDILLALNGLFPDTIEPIRAAFNDLLPQDKIYVWNAPGPVHEIDVTNNWRRQAAELTREAFLASLKPSIVVVSSLFEGLGDDAVTSIGSLSRSFPTAAVLFDLIPLINRSPYLADPRVEAWYENKLIHLRRADLLLAISESSRQESIEYMGFPPGNVVNISTAADPHFKVLSIDANRQEELLKKHGLKRPYVMYTGGIDHRKNIEGLIRAYSCLPTDVRRKHQLAVICSIQAKDRARLEALAKGHGLMDGELVLTGYVPEEELVALYNLCKVFAFPSLHEGFGLPALEAMACGRAVIGANTSSLPEVIGYEDALFDPFEDSSIRNKLERVLNDDAFRHTLEQHGRQRSKAFSWDKSAQAALTALDAHISQRTQGINVQCRLGYRPRLAYISPLPPEPSGISDYSVELLPELARYYQIDVVVSQEDVTTPWIRAHCKVRTVEWFLLHAMEFDRVLYHFGNSAFHLHMFSLLEAVPGVVVLHDFFLSGAISHMERTGYKPGIWIDSLYRSHGYGAIQRRFQAADVEDVVWQYPCNLDVLRNAQGIIVHSLYARSLARQWYGSQASTDWALVPLLRAPHALNENVRLRARAELGLRQNDFVVCSFGLLGPTKMNHRLVDAWRGSPLSEAAECVLFFVGKNDGGEYGVELVRLIKQDVTGRIRITGRTAVSVFHQYLAAADLGVQLRMLSRGETSAAALDCMNFGLATIVNANGSMADLPDDCVWKLRDDFTDSELSDALTSLWRDADRRQRLGRGAREYIRRRHRPRACAEQYFSAIERFHRDAAVSIPALARAIARLESGPTDDGACRALAEMIDRSLIIAPAQRQLLVDISRLAEGGATEGDRPWQRYILKEWFNYPSAGFRMEPVYATSGGVYRYARCFSQGLLGGSIGSLTDEPIQYAAGDVFIGLDADTRALQSHGVFFQELRRKGIKVKFVLYELPRKWMSHRTGAAAAEAADAVDASGRWLDVVAECDGAVCISKTLADELTHWLDENMYSRSRPFSVTWLHPGTSRSRSLAGQSMAESESTLAAIKKRPVFLMMGMVEPQAGHAQVLTAVEELWRTGEEVNLVIVGQQGELAVDIAERLRGHTEQNKRLFWLYDVRDDFLSEVFQVSASLIVGSHGRNFGLPMAKVTNRDLPMIIRGTPALREMAEAQVFCFTSVGGPRLAKEMRAWLTLHAEQRTPGFFGIPFLTLKDAAEGLMEECLPEFGPSVLRDE